MSHSFKHFPAGTCCCCKSQHVGKKQASRRFRHRVNSLIRQRKFDNVPRKSMELTSTWDLGGDGKMFYGFPDHPCGILRGVGQCCWPESAQWWAREMRK